MNNIDFSFTKGFPFEVDILEYMQTAYKDMLTAITQVFGDNLIVSGVELKEGSITNGFIVYDGELLLFQGGEAQDYFEVVETKIEKRFEDDIYREVVFQRKAVLTGEIGRIRLSTLKRLTKLMNLDTEYIKQLNTVEAGSVKELFRMGKDGEVLGFDGVFAQYDSTAPHKVFKILSQIGATIVEAMNIDLQGIVNFPQGIKENYLALENKYLSATTNGEFTGDLENVPTGSWWGQRTQLTNRPTGFTGDYCIIESFRVNNTDMARYVRLTDLTTLNIFQWSDYSASWNSTNSQEDTTIAT